MNPKYACVLCILCRDTFSRICWHFVQPRVEAVFHCLWRSKTLACIHRTTCIRNLVKVWHGQHNSHFVYSSPKVKCKTHDNKLCLFLIQPFCCFSSSSESSSIHCIIFSGHGWWYPLDWCWLCSAFLLVHILEQWLEVIGCFWNLSGPWPLQTVWLKTAYPASKHEAKHPVWYFVQAPLVHVNIWCVVSNWSLCNRFVFFSLSLWYGCCP